MFCQNCSGNYQGKEVVAGRLDFPLFGALLHVTCHWLLLSYWWLLHVECHFRSRRGVQWFIYLLSESVGWLTSCSGTVMANWSFWVVMSSGLLRHISGNECTASESIPLQMYNFHDLHLMTNDLISIKTGIAQITVPVFDWFQIRIFLQSW